MKKLLAITALAVMACSPALAATMASQPWVTNRIAEAEERVGERIVAATNAIPRADLTAATNYTDQALGRFAATGAVARASTYGTPNRWVDATGCVWEVVTDLSAWSFSDGLDRAVVYGDFYEELGWPVYGEDVRGSDSSDFYWFRTQAEALNAVRFVYIREDGTAVTATRTEYEATNLVGRVALTNDIPDVSGYATQQQATNAATAVADTKISTNNAAFVSAVLAVPLTGADAGDLAEIAEYGGYGTVGAALLALIAGLAALKRRVTSAETALAQKASLADLPYRLVEPGEWEFSDGETYTLQADDSTGDWKIYAFSSGTYLVNESGTYSTEEEANAALSELTSCSFTVDGQTVTATRAYALLDRAGNRVVVSGDTTLTLPAAVPGYLRDFLVRLEISGSTVPTITFAAPTGETLTYEVDGDEFPVPDEAGDWLYSFTESCVAHKFAVSLKKVNTVAQGGE